MATSTFDLRTLEATQTIATQLTRKALTDPTDEALKLAIAAEAAVLDIKGSIYRGQTLTSDGNPIIDRTRWCACPIGGEEAQYEAFNDIGEREAHGFICTACRAITQTG